MLIFLHGPDTFRISQKLKEIALQYRRVHGSALSFERFEAGQISFSRFLDIFNQPSMFVKKKLFFLEAIFDCDQFKKLFAKELEQISRSGHIVVVVHKGEVKKTDKFFLLLKKRAKTQEFAFLGGQKLKSWIVFLFNQLGAQIEPAALNELAGVFSSDTWALNSEIRKLAAFSKLVKKEDLNLFVKPSAEAAIFQTIDCLAQGDKKRALQMLEAHLSQGDSPFYLLTMIAYQFRNLLLVKQGSPPELHPFVLKKSRYLAARFSFEQLKEIFSKILETDLNVKTGRLMPREGLYSLVGAI